MSWRPTYSKITSSSYLHNLIQGKNGQMHSIYDEYHNTELVRKEQEEAEQLGRYFQQIKAYAQNIESKKEANFFTDIEWQLFFNTLEEMKGIRNNRALTNLFKGRDTGKKRQHRFEQDILAIIRSTESVYDKSSSKKNTKKIGNLQMGLGQQSTNVKINQNLLSNAIEDEAKSIMEQYGVKTKRFLEEKGKTGYALSSVSVKVDVAGNRVFVEQQAQYNLNKIGVSFNRFAELLLSATFTAKNYSVKKGGISLDKTQPLRAILDLIPEIDSSMTDDKRFASFIYAITNRMQGKGNPKDYNDEIQSNLAQISFIYELTGRGQKYDTESDELNNFLQQGAKYLIYNQHNGNNIYVTSTRYLIYQKLYLNNNLKYGHSMNIAKGLIKGNYGF